MITKLKVEPTIECFQAAQALLGARAWQLSAIEFCLENSGGFGIIGSEGFVKIEWGDFLLKDETTGQILLLKRSTFFDPTI